ncbi:MAG TPA: SEC-C domain-containing protein [Gallionellaceae bacterium]|nr:SEC-C domain-containing protein [Gallionellaceae bacterium]
MDINDMDEEMQEGMDELHLLITLFAGQVWRGATAEEAIGHIAKYGENLAPGMAAQLNPAAGPKAAFFRIVGRAMWNNLPQPKQGFRLNKLPEPGRNDACFCGSLHKYKQCCARMPDFPIVPAMMLDGLLGTMPRKRWSSLAGSSIDRSTVQHLVFLWQDEDRHEDVAALLEPWFKGEDVIKNADADLLDMLLESYVVLEKPRKRKSLAQAAIARGENVARGIGWQRIALMEAADGNDSASHKALVEAQRADPDNLNLAMLEVHLLIAAGKASLAQERAKYWALRLAKLNDPDLHDQIAWLREVVLNPQGAMMQITRKGDDAIAELEELLECAPQIACHYRLQPLDGSTGPFEPDARLGKVMKAWQAVFPSNPPNLTLMSTWNEAAWDDAAVWLTLLREQPLLWNSFEVLDDLVIALDGCGMSWVEETLIPQVLERALALFHEVLEKHGAAQLRCEWSRLQNRPALRLLARMAVDGMESEDTVERDKAFALTRRFVEQLNPHDNHGFRVPVVAGLVERGQAAEAVAIAARYPDDLADMQYTQALALHVAGREADARKAALSALKEYPKVGKALLATSLRQPRGDGRQGYTMGSDEEAWLYREEFRSLWERLGALPWLAELAGELG